MTIEWSDGPNYAEGHISPEHAWWEKLRAHLMFESEGEREVEAVSDEEIVCYLADTLEWDQFLADPDPDDLTDDITQLIHDTRPHHG